MFFKKIEKFIISKPKFLVFYLFSLISLGISSVSTLGATSFNIEYGLIIGGFLMLAAIPLHILGKKNSLLYIYSYMINFIGSGFSVSSYYLAKGISLNVSEVIIAAMPAGAVITVLYFMLRINLNRKKTIITAAGIINIILLVLAVIYWNRSGATLYSLIFFNLIVSIIHIIVLGLTIDHDERPALRYISYGSFGCIIILTVIVYLILSEGEGLDLGDLGIENVKRKKKKK